MKKALTLSACMALLSACSDLKSIGASDENQARDACVRAYPAVKGNMVALAKCQNTVDDKYVKPDNPNSDLMQALDTTRFALARDVDQGEITILDYQEQLQAEEAQINGEKQRRETERDHSTWGISHGLDSTEHDSNPLPIIPPG